MVTRAKKVKGFVMAGPIDTRFSINDSLNFYPVHDALGFAVFDAVSP